MKTYKNRLDFICEKSIEYLLYALMFFLPVSKSMIEVCATLAIIAWFIKKINNFERPKISAGVPLLFFVAICALTATLTTDNLQLSLRTLSRKTLEYILIFIMMAEVMNTPRRIANLIIVIAASSLIVGIDGLYQQITGFDFFRRFPLFVESKVSATFQFSNSLGTYLATILPALMALFIYKATGKKSRFFLIVLCGLLLICLLLTQSRGAWLGFFAGFLFVSLSIDKKTFLAVISVLVILVILVSTLGPVVVKEQLKSFFNLRGDLSTQDRVIIWATGWRMFLDRPIFGHGLGTFMRVFEKYRPPKYNEIVYAHNSFLQIASEIGTVGLLIFLWFVCSLIKTARRKYIATDDIFLKAATVGILGGIVSYLVNSFFDSTLFSLPLAVLFWSLAGLLSALPQSD